MTLSSRPSSTIEPERSITATMSSGRRLYIDGSTFVLTAIWSVACDAPVSQSPPIDSPGVTHSVSSHGSGGAL